MNKQELLSKMETIVSTTVNHYQSDFYDYDRKFIDEESNAQILWIPYDCGTRYSVQYQNGKYVGDPVILEAYIANTRDGIPFLITVKGEEYTLRRLQWRNVETFAERAKQF